MGVNFGVIFWLEPPAKFGFVVAHRDERTSYVIVFDCIMFLKKASGWMAMKIVNH